MEEQKINVCRALAAMFAAHEVTDEEIAFVGQTAAHLGLDEGAMKAVQHAFDAGLDFAEVAKLVTDPLLRRFLFSQVVAAALTDEHLSDKERTIVDATVAAFGWNKTTVSEFVELKQKIVALDRKAQETLGRLG